MAYSEEILNLNVEENLTVYNKSNRKSGVLKVLKVGEKVEIDDTKYGSWRKVHLVLNGKKVSGFILDRSIQVSYVEKVQRDDTIGFAYKNRKGFSLGGLYTSLSQPAFEENISEVKYSFSEFKSQELSAQVGYDFILSPQWSFRLSGIYRKTNYRGQAEKKEIIAPKVETNRAQSLIGVLGQYKYYPTRQRFYYLGLGVELSKGIKLEVTYDGSPIKTDKENLPLFVIPSVSLGGEFPLSKDIFLNIELRAGMEINSSPTQSLLEGLLGVSVNI